MTLTPKRLLSTLTTGAALQFALFAPLPASAIVLNIDDSNCAVWALSAPSGNTQTLTCTALGAPTCSISGASTGVPGGNAVALTATCSPGPVTYQWTGGTCNNGATTSICQASSAVSEGVVTYNVVASNSAGPGAQTSKSVTWSSTPVAVAPSGCTLTLTPSHSPTPVGDAINLQASCADGDPTEWTWTGPGLDSTITSVATNSATATSSGTLTYTVKGKNAAGFGPIVSKQLTVTSDSGGGTVGGAVAACSGFPTTKVMDIAIPAENAQGDFRKYTSSTGVFRNGAAPGFYATDALVIVFKAPPADSFFTLDVTHSGGATGSSTTRTFVLSDKSCDFAIPASASAVWAAETNVMSLRLSSGTPGSGRYDLTPGKEYYVNVKNSAYGGSTGCGVSRCDVFVTPGNP